MTFPGAKGAFQVDYPLFFVTFAKFASFLFGSPIVIQKMVSPQGAYIHPQPLL